MSIPPKELAKGLFRREGTSVPDAAVASELLLAGTEYQRKEQRESSCRWEWLSCICWLVRENGGPCAGTQGPAPKG
jgi:hypothetical protein